MNLLLSPYNLKDRLKKTRFFYGFKLFFFTMFFFPSITFGLLSAEIFPWALFGSFIFLRQYSKDFLLVLIFFFLSWILSILFLGPTDSLRSIASYMNTLYAFAFTLSISQIETLKFIKLIRVIFITLLILGLLQHFNLVNFLDDFLKFLIPRGSSGALIEANRGVRLLSSEPARAGNELIFFYMLFRYVYIKPKFRLLFDVLFTIYLLIVIQSFMVIAFMLLFLLLNMNYKSIILLLLSSLLIVYFGFNLVGGRTVNLIRDIIEIGNWNDIVLFLINTSGHRLITIYSSFLYGIQVPFGGGLGNWYAASIDAINITGVDVSKFSYFQIYGGGYVIGTRSSGFLSNIILETGLIGFLFILGYILKSLKKYFYDSKDSKIIIFMFLFKILFIGSVGHPVAWIVVILLLKHIYFEKINLKKINTYRNE